MSLNRDSFLFGIYRLSSEGDFDAATDAIFDTIDRLLLDGKFDECDDLLSRVDPDKLDTKLMRSFLTISFAAKDKLPSRFELYEKIYAKMKEIRGLEKTDKILKMLK